jgi:hypothetical protein
MPSLNVPTNDPGATEREHNARGWITAGMLVLKFYPAKQESLTERKLYEVQFWRPEQAEFSLK